MKNGKTPNPNVIHPIKGYDMIIQEGYNIVCPTDIMLNRLKEKL